jgi:ketopantoate hydroxymethyltransferase
LGSNLLSFLLTDVLNLNGTVTSSLYLPKRLEKIGEAVQAYRNAVQSNKIPANNHPFRIMGKNFV